MEKLIVSGFICLCILFSVVRIVTSYNHTNRSILPAFKHSKLLSDSYSDTSPHSHSPNFPTLIRDNDGAIWGDLDKLKRLFPAHNTSTLSQVYLSLANLYLPSTDDANPQCARDLRAIARGVLSPSKDTQWAFRVVDSWGKYHDGLLEGSFLFPGFFQECLDVAVNDKQLNAHFEGQYCTLGYMRKPDVNQTEVKDFSRTLNGHGFGSPYVSAFILKSVLDKFFYGTCMPSTCTKEELVGNINRALSSENLEVSVAECNAARQKLHLKTPHIIGIILFSFLSIILLLATSISMVSKHIPSFSSGILKYLLVFSVSDNIMKIFTLTDTKKTSKDTISCLHGIRFLSICWVIIGHQYAFSIEGASNQYDLLKIIKPVSFQVIANAFLSVDTFFFLSGLLVCYVFLKQNQTGQFNLLVYYVHRVVRLLPSILVLTAFLSTVSELIISSSPFSWVWNYNIAENCRNHWWWDSTFATNFLQVFKKQGSCLGHCWYVAVDTQLYALMPLVIYPLVYAPRKGLSLLLFWTTISCIIPAAIIGAYKLSPMNIISDPGAEEYSNKVYFMTWARASPYLIGVLTGYILYKNANRQLNSTVSTRTKMVILFGWILAIIVNTVVVFGMWQYNHFIIPLEKSTAIPESVSILYGGLHRAVWAITLSWIVCCCHWGYGGPINWFLSHPIWQPFSRLTYSFYLTSLPVQSAIFTLTYRPTYYDNVNKIQETCGVLFFTFLASIILSLVSEIPASNLEKLILEKLNMNRIGCGEYREIAVLVEEETTESDRGEGDGNEEVEGELGEHEIIRA